MKTAAMPKSLWSFIWHFIKPYKIPAYTLVCASLIVGLWGPLNSYLLKYIVDAADKAQPGEATFLFWPATFMVLNFFLIDNGMWRVINALNRHYQPLIKNKITSETFSYLAHAPYNFFLDKLSGRLASRITILADHIERILENHVPNFLRALSLVICALVGMWSVDFRFFSILIGWFVIFFCMSVILSKKLAQLSNRHAACESYNAGQIVDSLANISNVRLFSGSAFEVSRLSQFLMDTTTAYRKMKLYLISLHALQGTLITVMLAGMLYYLVHLYGQNDITIGDFVLVIGLSFEMGHMIWYTMGIYDDFNLSAGKCKQSLETLFTPYEMVDHKDAKSLSVQSGNIVFDQVSFHYQDDQKVFHTLSLSIKAQQKVGLVGFSGAGKSTFVHLLLRFFDPESGRILIDGQDIKTVTRTSLRDHIAMIPQETTLFHRTIRENIRYSDTNATDAEVIEAAQKAHAHEFIMKLPDGYDSLVGERGVKLSGGQRQRIAIARALLRKTPIIILDEATSALDSVTEKNIQDSLKTLMTERTTIVVAHRLSTLLDMDRILVFNQGRIIEDGSHADLIKKNGHYAMMWHRQAGGFLPDAVDTHVPL